VRAAGADHRLKRGDDAERRVRLRAQLLGRLRRTLREVALLVGVERGRVGG